MLYSLSLPVSKQQQQHQQHQQQQHSMGVALFAMVQFFGTSIF